MAKASKVPRYEARIRKPLLPGQKVPLQLSARERELILKRTLADDELTAPLRVAPTSNKAAVYAFTLDDLEELMGDIAFEANHTKDKKLQKELDPLFARIETVLESYTDEADTGALIGHRVEFPVPEPRKNRIREERIHNEVIVDAYGSEEQALGWYYYLENRIQFPFTARCIVSKVVSQLRKSAVCNSVAMWRESRGRGAVPTYKCRRDHS